jgi:hypothetical protein
VNGDKTNAPAIGDDTIELQLTPEQVLELSRAAEVAKPAAPASRFRHWHRTPIAKMAAATLGYVALAWWSSSQLAWRPEPSAAAAATPAIAIPQPASISESSEPAVRVMNPFDVKEVFEFPAGTGQAEGRAKVAQILMQRAHERQSQWEHIKPAASLRTASLYRARYFQTRISDGAKPATPFTDAAR